MLISLFSLLWVVQEPVRETALTPVKESRSAGFPLDFDPPYAQEWVVVIVRRFGS